MYLKNSPYKDQILKEVQFPYGTFYFLDRIIISEINQGVSFTYEQAKPVIETALEFYGDDAKIGYVSNRINNYALAPQDWLKFFRERENIHAVGIVAYTPIGLTNIILEKIFIRSRVKRFTSLDFAMKWTSSVIYTPSETLKPLKEALE
ncbi:hypothetical protein [Gilvibacter sp.]|uniref:hypothetical protein n=1 Tax=Gilvibacter sp. TaxID=2729997 RepID=UPI003F49F7AB